LTNFSNGKQTQESLENGFPENKNGQKKKYFSGNQIKFFFDWKVFLLIEKYFLLTNFSNNK
jgi:hypothetical protein